jgi:hypothetical protein
MYIYPDNLRAKPTLWLWQLRDLGIIGVGLLFAVLALAELRFLPPIVLVRFTHSPPSGLRIPASSTFLKGHARFP